jgi:hypothetical protein
LFVLRNQNDENLLSLGSAIITLFAGGVTGKGISMEIYILIENQSTIRDFALTINSY